MPTPKDLYITGVHRKLGYFATWLPGRTLNLGDFGVLTEKSLDYKGQLANPHLGIAFNERIDASAVDYVHTSDSGVTIDVHASAEAAGTRPPVGGSADISFDQQGAFVFHAEGCVGRAIADQVDLEAQLRAAYQDHGWRLEWVVVTEIIRVQRATILISNSAQAKVQLAVHGSVAAAAVNLASAAASVSFAQQSGDVTKVIAAEGLTPLYRLARLSKGWFSSAVDLNPIRSADPEEGKVKLLPLTLDDDQHRTATRTYEPR